MAITSRSSDVPAEVSNANDKGTRKQSERHAPGGCHWWLSLVAVTL